MLPLIPLASVATGLAETGARTPGRKFIIDKLSSEDGMK